MGVFQLRQVWGGFSDHVGTTGSCWEGKQEKQKYLCLSSSTGVLPARGNGSNLLLERVEWELGSIWEILMISKVTLRGRNLGYWENKYEAMTS